VATVLMVWIIVVVKTMFERFMFDISLFEMFVHVSIQT
jgi:hypothetical protein